MGEFHLRGPTHRNRGFAVSMLLCNREENLDKAGPEMRTRDVPLILKRYQRCTAARLTSSAVSHSSHTRWNADWVGVPLGQKSSISPRPTQCEATLGFEPDQLLVAGLLPRHTRDTLPSITDSGDLHRFGPYRHGAETWGRPQ